MFRNLEPWMQGALIGAGVTLILFVIIPGLVRWVWRLEPWQDDTWDTE